MSEIEKLYENARVKKQIPKICSDNELYCKECKAHIEDAMPYCKNADYPLFTAEKQLSLIKWLAKIYEVSINWHNHYNSYRLVIRDYRFNGRKNHSVCLNGVNLDETLATVINKIWQDLTNTEKEQIKEILK